MHLNHGSYGGCPTAVLSFQQELQQRVEENPFQFFELDWPNLLGETKDVIGELVGTSANNLAVVRNATTAASTILRSLPWREGDEIVFTDHTYSSCRNALHFIAENHNVKLIRAQVPFPIQSPDLVVDTIVQKLSPRTRLVFLDHITSATGLILPVEALIDELNKRNIQSFIDGAHAPGMVPLNIDALSPTYYTGNFHKWLCTPKGAAFLYVSPEQQSTIRPLTISRTTKEANPPRFDVEFGWQGTDDTTAILSVPRAIEVLSSLRPGGLDAHMKYNHDLLLKARNLLLQTLGTPAPCPDSMLGSMATLPLASEKIDDRSSEVFPKKLYQEWGIIIACPGISDATIPCFRISAQAYNSIEQYEYLAEILKKPGIREL